MQSEFEGEDLDKVIAMAKAWVRRARGRFSAFVFAKENDLPNVHLRDQILDELVRQRWIEKDEAQNNIYHRVDRTFTPMDWVNAEVEAYPVWLPLGLNEKAVISPGNIIIVAGETNAGKTAFVLNVVYRNMASMGGAHEYIRLLNSEMHPAEFKQRAHGIDNRQGVWDNLEVGSRTKDFHLVIEPNSLNVIDYLENLDNFWKVGEKIAQIHDALDSGIAIICLQKRIGERLARGGDFTQEKARLAVSLYYDGFANYMQITKCKFPASYPNPNGQEIDFKIDHGFELTEIEPWQWVTPEQREARTKSRQREAQMNLMNSQNRGFD